MAIIGAVESVPLLLAASKSSAVSSASSFLGRTFAVNSWKMASVNGGIELGSQYLSNRMANNDWGLGGIDWIDVGSNAIFSKGGEVIFGSSMDFSYDKGFQFHTDRNLLENMALGLGKSGVNSKLDSTFRGTIGNFSPVLSNVLTTTTQFNVSLLIDTTKRSTNKDDE